MQDTSFPQQFTNKCLLEKRLVRSEILIRSMIRIDNSNNNIIVMHS